MKIRARTFLLEIVLVNCAETPKSATYCDVTKIIKNLKNEKKIDATISSVDFFFLVGSNQILTFPDC